MKNFNKHINNYSKPLICGIKGLALTNEEKVFFNNNHIFGFILFKRNISNKIQLQNLINELKSLPNNPLIFIDQEGGKVARLTPPIIKNNYPSAEELSKNYNINKNSTIDAVYNNYSLLMNEIKELRIDSPVAPVADLRHDDAHDIIGDRSFGYQTQQVIDLALSAINAIIDNGGIPIVKHIPGHGRAKDDSHLKLPIIDTHLSELEATDFLVFKELFKNKSIKYAMTAHVVINAIDDVNPVTLSNKVISFIRENLGFSGIILTDAIDMFALHTNIDFRKHNIRHNDIMSDNFQRNHPDIHKQFILNLKNIAKSSIDAGCDIICHCSGNLDEIKAICEVI